MAERHLTFHFDPDQMADIKAHVDERVADALDQVAEQLRAADALAGGIRSFMSSLPFQPPEAIGFQARVKLAGPLARYDEIVNGAALRRTHNDPRGS